MFSAFQSNAYQTNAYQISSEGVVYNDVVLLGGDMDAWHHKSGKVKKYETASELVDKLVDSFKKPPIEQVKEAKQVIEQLSALSIAEIPIPDFTLTYEQILEIQRIIQEEIKQLLWQQEEEDFLIMCAALIL